jgi:hypothetical protein
MPKVRSGSGLIRTGRPVNVLRNVQKSGGRLPSYTRARVHVVVSACTHQDGDAAAVTAGMDGRATAAPLLRVRCAGTDAGMSSPGGAPRGLLAATAAARIARTVLSVTPTPLPVAVIMPLERWDPHKLTAPAPLWRTGSIKVAPAPVFADTAAGCADGRRELPDHVAVAAPDAAAAPVGGPLGTGASSVANADRVSESTRPRCAARAACRSMSNCSALALAPRLGPSGPLPPGARSAPAAGPTTAAREALPLPVRRPLAAAAICRLSPVRLLRRNEARSSTMRRWLACSARSRSSSRRRRAPTEPLEAPAAPEPLLPMPPPEPPLTPLASSRLLPPELAARCSVVSAWTAGTML